MAENVPTGTGSYHCRQSEGIVRIHYAGHRTQRAMGDTCFGVHFQQVKNGHARRFTSSSGRRRYGDQRLQIAGHRISPADGRIDVVQKIRRVGSVQIGDFCSIDAGATTDADKAVKPPVDSS